MVAAFLEEECEADPAAAARAATLSQGSIGAALGHLEAEGVAAAERNRSLEFLRAATGGRRGDAYKAALGFGPGGARGLLGLLAALQLWLPRPWAPPPLGRDDRVVNADELPFLKETAATLRLTPDRVAAAVDQVENARMLALGNVNPPTLHRGAVAGAGNRPSTVRPGR